MATGDRLIAILAVTHARLIETRDPQAVWKTWFPANFRDPLTGKGRDPTTASRRMARARDRERLEREYPPGWSA
jgi:hypothetical protein